MSSSAKLLVLDEMSVRGVQNPLVIDLISLNPRTNRVELLLIETRSWGSTPEQLEQLEEKLNNYLDYVLDGHLAEHYPQYGGLPITFRLESVESPGARELSLLNAFQQYSDSIGLKFEHAELAQRTDEQDVVS